MWLKMIHVSKWPAEIHTGFNTLLIEYWHISGYGKFVILSLFLHTQTHIHYILEDKCVC